MSPASTFYVLASLLLAALLWLGHDAVNELHSQMNSLVTKRELNDELNRIRMERILFKEELLRETEHAPSTTKR